jgi:acetyl-CoA carboxylase biotin carboxyl carrier protein
MIPIEEIKCLIDLVYQSRIKTLDMTTGEMRIRIEAKSHTACATSNNSNSLIAESPHRPAGAGAAIESATISNRKEIRAPTDGIVHLTPSPGAPPFVSVGRKVKPEETVCVIEVMKMFFPVQATVDGTIQTIPVKDGQHIGFEEVLFVLS